MNILQVVEGWFPPQRWRFNIRQWW